MVIVSKQLFFEAGWIYYVDISPKYASHEQAVTWAKDNFSKNVTWVGTESWFKYEQDAMFFALKWK
jgi:hypothetical protein